MPNEILNLKDELLKKEEMYYGSYEPFGMTLLTDPGYVSGSRCVMFTNHLKQLVNLKNPDIPNVGTGFENMVGENSTGYTELENDTTLFRRIYKFDEPGMENFIHYNFVFDEKTQTFDVIKKYYVEDLTEKYGYGFNTDTLDEWEEEETLEAGTVVSRSYSYDDHMNYRYGKNAVTMFALSPFIIEDAIIIREGFAKDGMVSIESEKTDFILNENDIMRNLYGDDVTYKCFPDVGECTIKKIIASIARVHKKQVAYTLKKENMNKPNFRSDAIRYGDGQVVDIDIWCNKPLDEIPDNSFNAQVIKYIKMQKRFFRKVIDTCEEIFESGYSWSEDINALYDRAVSMTDPNTKSRDESGSVPSFVKMKFHIVRDVGVSVGQKITARCGNKGVVSLILPDDEMPVLENGRPVDLVYSTLGMPNRLITFPLFEQSMTFIANRMIELKFHGSDDIRMKEKLWFDIMKRFNKHQGTEMHEYYKKKNAKQKREFWKDVENYVYTIVDPPLWSNNDESLFESIRQIYKDYPFIKPYKVFIKKWGRYIPIMKDMIIGHMYVLKLKQTSKKNFSERATGGLNQRGLPTKTTKAKHHEELISDTPVSHSDQELNNTAISVDPEITARYYMNVRSSKTGRRKTGIALGTQLDGIEKFESNNDDTNINVTILQAFFKTMGASLQFESERMRIDTPINNCDTYYDSNGGMFLGSSQEFIHHKKNLKAKEFYEEDGVFIGSKEDYMRILKEAAEEIDDEEV